MKPSDEFWLSSSRRPASRAEVAEMLGMKSRRSGHLTNATKRLRNLAFIELTIPDKPQSRNHKMQITEKGRAWMIRHSN